MAVAATMQWFFKKDPGPKALPKDLRKEVINKFYVDAEKAGRLMYIEREGRYAGRPVQYVRIYDPELLQEEQTIRQYEDVSGHWVSFEGRLEKGKPPLLKDLRVSLFNRPKFAAVFPVKVSRPVDPKAGHQEGPTPN